MEIATARFDQGVMDPDQAQTASIITEAWHALAELWMKRQMHEVHLNHAMQMEEMGIEALEQEYEEHADEMEVC